MNIILIKGFKYAAPGNQWKSKNIFLKPHVIFRMLLENAFQECYCFENVYNHIDESDIK